MKKILVVLLVLAVATGVFAQEGEFSFSGRVDIGVVVDLDPLPNKDVMVTSEDSQYNQTYDGWDGVKGRFGINYNRDGFGAGLQITDSNLSTAFIGKLNYSGENFTFAVESNITPLLGWNGSSFNELRGDYSFLNGLVYLEAVYATNWQGNKFWASDDYAAFRNYNGNSFSVFGESGNTFTKVDGNYSKNYLAADVRLQGLSFGVMMNGIFRGGTEEVEDIYYTPATSGNPADGLYLIKTTKTPKAFVEDVLKNMILGVKFELNPIEIAAQFLVKEYGAYLGGKWFVGPVTVGVSYMGILNEQKTTFDYEKAIGDTSKIDKETGIATVTETWYKQNVKTEATNNTRMKVGANVQYDTDGYGATVGGYLGMDGKKETSYTRVIGFEPGIYYNVIPTHLKFKLDTGFYFINQYKNNTERSSGEYNTVQFKLQPQLFWNFLGTGAGDYSGNGTGITIRYKMVGGDTTKDKVFDFNNKFDVNFKWSF